MSDQIDARATRFDMTQLTQENAVKWVIQCEKIPVDSLWKSLSTYVAQLKIASGLNTLDVLESFIHIVYKGFYHKSECANALRYFYWGYFAREQEEVIRNASKDCRAKAISIISSKKHFTDIIFYLYTNGCSQQRDLVKYLGVDKSNLSRLLRDLVNCGLVNKMSGPKYVFYELTQEGYNYFKQHNIGRHYSIQATKKVARLESEALQIRNELIHAQTANYSHSFLQESPFIPKSYVREIPQIKLQTEMIPNPSLEASSPLFIGDEIPRWHKEKKYLRKAKYAEKDTMLINSW